MSLVSSGVTDAAAHRTTSKDEHQTIVSLQKENERLQAQIKRLKSELAVQLGPVPSYPSPRGLRKKHTPPPTPLSLRMEVSTADASPQNDLIMPDLLPRPLRRSHSAGRDELASSGRVGNTDLRGDQSNGHHVEMHGSSGGLHRRHYLSPPRPTNLATGSATKKTNRKRSNGYVRTAASGSADGNDDDIEMLLPLRTQPNASQTAQPLLEDFREGSFWEAVTDRASWLVGLLILQSLSSFIISRNERLLQQHLVLVRFLTMLVGAGGNAGNQASVRVIRGLAVGSIRSDNVLDCLWTEFRMGITLSIILGVAGCLRVAIFATPLLETVAITLSLMNIVFISIVLGAVLPLAMRYLLIDPAHSSTTIQVIMDILGVTITVQVAGTILDSTYMSLVGDGGSSHSVDGLRK